MTTSLDLALLPLVRHGGKDISKLPGLYISSPPRRAARGRSSERMFIYLSMEGNAPLSPKELDKLLDHMADQYYKMSGSSTAAMRSVAETLNELLLKRNLNSASRGRHATGMLAMGVVRFNHLYLLQSGSSHAYIITVDGTRQLYDPASTGRGLGLSRATNLRFHQSELNAGDVLIVSPNPPMSWNTTTLRNMHGLSLGDLYHRLGRRAEGDLEAVLMLAKQGKGDLRLITPQPAQGKDASTSRRTQPPIEPKRQPSQSPEAASPPLAEPAQKIPQNQPGDESVSQAVSVSPVKPAPKSEGSPEPEAKRNSLFENLRQTWASNLGPGMLRSGRTIGNGFRKVAQTSRTMFERMLPDETMFEFSGPTMAFIAIAVPLVVVAIAAAVYFQRGQGRYFEAYLLEAGKAIDQAEQLELVDEQRIAWKAALEYLDLAESYQVTEDSQRLRDIATSTLDAMDKIVRINYRPALVTGLPSSVEITRMVISLENDLYMLDGVEGDVYRAVFTGDGYELDFEFRCGSVPTPLIVGPLVDIEALPPGHPNGATVIGMDANGNLAQCIPAGKEQLSFPMPPPDSNWGSPQSFAMASGDLFVLDPLTNSVWVYDGASEYRDLPNFFFGNQVPTLQDVVDLTVSDGRLYLLYRDGHLATSIYGSNDYTDPADYQDPRDGFESGPTIGDAVFNQIQFAPPPDPSIYMLDPGERAIYHFSLALVYQRQYHGLSTLPKEPATAFAVSHNHQVFLAIGHQIYSALLP